MAISVKLQSSAGDQQGSKVTEDEALVVTNLTYPPFGFQLSKPFRQFLTLDGTATGSEDMGVDGSVTPQDFYVQADPNNDRYITELSFILGYGSSAPLYDFADLGSALTNGVDIFYTNFQGDNDVKTAIKTNAEMLRATVDTFLTNNWQSRNFNAINDYGYMGTIKLSDFMPPFGIKLDRGSKQRLVVRIQDDLSTVADLFNFNASGFERFDI